MSGKGGYRPGAGRPAKADEERVRDLSVKAIIDHYGSEDKGFKHLLESKEPALIKFVFEHAYGKPRDKMDMNIEDLPAVVLKMPDGVTLDFPSNTEEAENTEPNDE